MPQMGPLVRRASIANRTIYIQLYSLIGAVVEPVIC
jgi:hypothetical protein